MKVENLNEKRENLRKQRKSECFTIINRGKLWYDSLTYEQLAELKAWYFDWLNVTETLIVPAKPKWLNDKISPEEIIIC